MNRSFHIVAIAVSGFVFACAQKSEPTSTQRGNPASAHCVEVGGRLAIEKGPAGEFGVCYFEDNRQCEEWALLRGQCPTGGKRVSGYATQAGRYCAITGGVYTTSPGSDAHGERGTCTFGDGKMCDADAYYNGTCTR